MVRQNSQLCSNTLRTIKADLKKAERAIDEIIAADPELTRLFGLITLVRGIGKITATMIIITTNEFKDIKDPKKFSCHAGVAPFMKESGIFKGRAKVSQLLKTLELSW